MRAVIQLIRARSSLKVIYRLDPVGHAIGLYNFIAKYCTALHIGLSHARPNSGISGDLLSENEAKPAVI